MVKVPHSCNVIRHITRVGAERTPGKLNKLELGIAGAPAFVAERV